MCTNNSEKSTEEKGEMDAETSSSKSSSLKIILRYADRLDILLMVLGTFGAVGDGLSTNCLLVYVSRLFNSLGFDNSPQNHGQFMLEIEKCSLYFVYLGLAVMAVAFMEGYCWSKTSERQVLRIRYKYLEAVLKQEVGFFDSQDATTSEIINSISKDTSLIQELLSEKVPIFLMNMSMFVSGLAFSAYFSWKLALVAFPTIILLIIPGLIYGKYLVYLSKKSFNEYAKANTIVGQALSSIKTVYAFTAERSIIEKYSSILDGAKRLGIKQGIAKGLAIGSTGLSFAIWGLLAWYGSRLIMYKGESGGRIYAAGVSFVLGGLALGVALPEVKYFTEASVAASRIFQRIDRIPQIDTNNGLVLEKIRGEIEFERVQFTYPSRPDALVLNNFSLKIEAGKTVALVGASGSGKSTAVALVQRFYDASGGSVRIDGVDIRSLQLKWLREQMGLVSQEHALFGTSVRENILFGKLDATMDDVVAAAIAANAHNFIRQLPQGYETKIGERGSLLSGGQKQRIAIARAIIRNPVILLLDEATSALDSESETLVQNALDQASMGRTTLVVAHKLSTVRNADVIAVVSGGSIVEIGSHNNLIKTNGHYARLAKLQRQFSALDQDQSIVEPRFSSAARSSASRRSSPASFASPLSIINNNNNNNNNNNYNNYPPPSMYRLLSLNSPEWKQAVIGSLSAVIFGTVQPLYALTIGGMISAFFSPSHAEMQARIERYALIFSSLCLVSITLNLCQHYNFAYMGECLTRRIRLRMLEKMLTFEAAWFDQEQNSSAALCFRLSNEASMVKSIIADRLSLLIQTTSAVTTAMIIGLIIAWKLALVMIAVQPLTIFCFYTRKVILSTITGKFVKAQNKSTQIAAEAVYNHRTVTSFGSIRKVLEIFDEAQDEPRKEARKKSWLAGAGIGSAQGLTFICWALDFWYGGTLVNRGEISAGDVFRTFFILVSTGKVVAEAGSMTSDLAKGSAAVASIFAILDRQSLILGSYNSGDSDENKGMKLEKMRGGIEIKRVDFAYPGRPQTLVLRDFSLEVKEGTSIGLVGKSGCGKSTVIALIQRFYDVDCGSIKVDGVGIRLLDIEWYRKRMALVSQDPVIYSGSIRDNILLGKIDASENEVVEAARSANAHEFICALKNGYETECGERGLQLSGGQKQRIAIARAIIRDPIILLLDEATSALDVQSEQLVQEALDRVMVGRTTVVVAHRLNTIKNLDSIAVVMDGKVVERGSYSQLKNKRGAFFNLASISVAIQGGVSRPL